LMFSWQCPYCPLAHGSHGEIKGTSHVSVEPFHRKWSKFPMKSFTLDAT
jgi:hypothetical protein